MKVEIARKIAAALNEQSDAAEATGKDEIELSLIGVLDTAVGVALDSLQRAINEAQAASKG